MGNCYLSERDVLTWKEMQDIMEKIHPDLLLTNLEIKIMCAAYSLAVEQITEEWENALQSDLEHGVKSLNEQYTKELAAKHPKIFSFGETLKTFRP